MSIKNSAEVDSMDWFQVAEFSGSEDLSGLSRFLHQQEIPHRVTEEGGALCLWVLGEAIASKLKQQFVQDPHWHRQFNQSHPQVQENIAADTLASGSLALGLNIVNFPITCCLILLGALGALLIEFDKNYQWVSLLTAQNFVIIGERVGFYSLEAALSEGQLWRLWTPMFLHFGLFHILFNGLWMWEFGRRIEPVLGGGRYLVIVMLISLVSNLAQYLWQGPSLFGGLSGVLYGLLGYIWMRQRFYPGELTPLPPAIIGFMLLWQVLCMTGAVGFFIDGQIANAAHLGGLLSGMVLGFAPIWLKKQKIASREE
jgi:GlpG protein